MILHGCWELRERLSESDTATVDRARELATGADVVVKRISQPGRARFDAEAAALQRLRHPGVVPLLDAFEEDGTGHLVLPFLPGRALRSLVSQANPLAPTEAIALGRSLLAALGAVHDAGLVHADVTPENALVDDGGRVTLIDFGLARETGTAAANDLAGTPAYMSPEQVRGEPLDARSDLYGAAAVLYELLTGQPPFVGETSAQLRHRQLTSTPAPPAVVSADGAISDALSDLVLRALAKDPARRPESAPAFAALLAAVK